jgi:hypothetical protein
VVVAVGSANVNLQVPEQVASAVLTNTFTSYNPLVPEGVRNLIVV